MSSVSEILENAISIAEEVIQAKRGTGELERGAVSDDPVLWCEQTLGTYYHKKQRELMYSMRDNRRTACHAAHGVGKDFAVASFICWWVCRYMYENVMVVCTAPSNRQVKQVLFAEIGALRYMGKLPGEVLTQTWKAKTEKGLRTVAIGAASKAGQAQKTFQGYHNAHLLVVIDEANGVPDDVYLAIDGMMTAESSRLCAIGNPDFAEGEFYVACTDEESGYKVIGISVFDTPNYSGEECPESCSEAMPNVSYVADMKRKHGETSPVFRSKVLGEFTTGTSAGYFPFEWIIRARDYRCEEPGGMCVVSADIGAGGDPTVVMVRLGHLIREVTPVEAAKESDGKKVGKAIAEIAKNPAAYCKAADPGPETDDKGNEVGSSGHARLATALVGRKAAEVHIDSLNVGATAYAACCVALKDYKYHDANDVWRSIEVIGCNVQEKAYDNDRFINRKAELAEVCRERLCETGLDLDPDDDKLMEDLRSVKMVPAGARMKVLDKKATRKDLHRSTDRYDTLVLSLNVRIKRQANMEELLAMLQAANDGLERESPHRL